MDSNDQTFTIIGVGASAGGLQAIQQLIGNVPIGFPHTIVLVQHLSTEYKSMMASLLEKETDLPIHMATHELEVEAGAIYLIPPGKNMRLNGGKLQLSEKPAGPVLNLPINIFFESLAAERKENAIGIVLSGSGSDGAIGLRAIKEAGGLTIAQSPSTAGFDSMPNSAIQSGAADLILAPWEMPSEIIRFLIQPLGTLSEPLFSYRDKLAFEKIVRFLHQKTSLNFGVYKKPTILRRLQRRIVFNRCHDLEDYFKYLENHPEEAFVLYRELLIGVTRFFRDDPLWDQLRHQIIPDLIKAKPLNEQIKCWVVGCSSGEEAYSLAITIDEILIELNRHQEVKIFATDVEREQVDRGARGVYPESIKAEVSPKRLEYYFSRAGKEYQVQSNVRRTIIFSQHNALQDPPFGKMDIVICRNLLIYLEQSAQEQLIHSLHYALNLGGVLILGPSEALGNSAKAFIEIDRRWRIYKSRSEVLRAHLSANQATGSYLTGSTRSFDGASVQFSNLLNEVILEEMNGACVFIDDRMNMIHAVGNYKQFLTLPDQTFSLNILKMASSTLASAINASVLEAGRQNKQIYNSNGWLLLDDGSTQIVHLIVTPFMISRSGAESSMILMLPQDIKQALTFETPIDFIDLESTEADSRQAELERVLQETRGKLQLAYEEAQSTHEEFQSTNEELMAANEELQSTNEELQSVNEELHTVNTEFQLKIEELQNLNSDIENLLTSTQIGTIFLDQDHRIRRFTPAIAAQFDILSTDIGRPLAQLAGKLQSPDIAQLSVDIDTVIHSGQVLEKQVTTQENKIYIQRIHPFIATDNSIQGAVLSFVDITDQIRAESTITSLSHQLQLALNSAEVGMWEYAIDTRKVTWSDEIYNIYGVTREELPTPEYDTWLAYVPEEDRPPLKKVLVTILEREKPLHIQFKINHSNRGLRYIQSTTTVYRNAAGDAESVIGTIIDITELTEQKIALELAVSELKRAESLAGIGTTRVDLQTGEVWWSDQMYRLMGYEPGAISPQFGLDSATVHPNLAHPEDQDNAKTVVKDVIRTGEAKNISIRIVWPDRSIHHVINHFAVNTDDQGKPVQLLSTTIDVTEVRRSDYEKQYWFNESQDLQTISNFEGQFIQLSRSWTSTLGWTLDDLMSRPFLEFVDPRDRDRTTEAFEKLLDGESVFSFTNRYMHKDGSLRWLSWYASPWLDEGLIFSTARDITQELETQKAIERSEAQFRAIFDSAPVGITLLDNGEPVLVNSELERFFGISEEEIIRRKSFISMTHPDDRQTGIEQYARIQQGEIDHYTIEERYFHANGNQIWGEMTVIQTARPNSQTPLELAMVRDITHQKEATYRLEETISTLVATNEALEHFTYAASHDLREPLNTIGNFVNLIQAQYGDRLDEEGQQMLQFVTDSAERMKGLVNALLEYAWMSPNRLNMVSVDFDALMETVSDDLGYMISTNQATIQLTPNHAVYADPVALRQVLINLVSNSIKYRKPDVPPRLEITVDENDTHHVIQVTDNGIGIDPKHWQKIFEIFRQLHPRNRFEGVGLGLSLCKRIAQLHSGDIWVDRSDESGSTFVLTFKKQIETRS